MTYTSTFRSAGIGTTYAGAFKSANIGSKNVGIGYIHIFIKAVPTQVKTLEQGLKVPGPIKALVQVCVTLSPHSKANGLKCREKKCRDRNFDPILVLFRAIPVVLKTLGQPHFFVVNFYCEVVMGTKNGDGETVANPFKEESKVDDSVRY